MGANGQRIIGTLAAVKCLAVNKSFKVDNGLVAVCNWSVFYGYQSCILILDFLQFFLYIFICNGCVCLLYLNALVLA